MTNIQDIAKLAGVSTATVSRIINNQGYVSPETRERVQSIIDQLDYVPNINAVSLKKGKTRLIGIIALVYNDELSVFVHSFVNVALQHGYNITMFITNGDGQKEIEALEMLRRKQLDALVCVVRINDWKLIEGYTKYGPIVTWERVVSDKLKSVFMNHYEGYMLVLEHLYKKGYRRIVNIYGRSTGKNTKSRIRAYEDFCERYNLNPHEFQDFYDQRSIENGEKIASWWVEQKVKPDAFICTADYLACALLAEARRLNLNVPNDFAVVGFGNMDIAHFMDLTTVHYPIDLQAENAFIIILNQLNNHTNPLRKLEFKLIERKTT
ncbi:LacI family DNA-binding transcriptional regulator [Bacillus cihuensis]|uniref:LacI family DNA-binding transcriptional regulator n=1 Tax=Bacillus cihuensis TaxID=1208599 RepID=UPI00041B33DE|nr:LacI family DNA-binding transcriptional regulator [Bacillus cihuensis]